MASSGTGLLVFIDDVTTEDRSSRINSEVYRDILRDTSGQMGPLSRIVLLCPLLQIL